jgi:uncharacterized protein (TIGR02391 family)
MNQAKPFESPDLQALAKVLEGTATHAELIGLFHAARLTEPQPPDGLAKWKRIFNALVSAQNETGTGNFALRFTQLAVSPRRFLNHAAQFDELRDNYFHAVFEATKSVAEKIRQTAGVQGDGSEIVDAAFGLAKGAPILAINSLGTKTEEDEQKGFSNLLKGMFGMFRNVTGHAPKIHWEVTEQDAIDLLTLVSLIHRRLDTTISFGQK